MPSSAAKTIDADAPVASSGFTSLGLDPRLTATIGYDEPSPIQKQSIPVLLQGKDLIGLAGTGTGKTAAFALPAIHRLVGDPSKRTGVAVLILTPTRELCIQVAKAVKTYGKPVGIDVVAVYGGTAYSGQIQAIRRGVDFVVATPGRALDLFRKGKFPLDGIKIVVLDEADEMLDMGFADDIDTMLNETPKDRQTMLFSATMPPRIEEIAHKHLKKPVRIHVAREVLAKGEEAKVRHTAYLVKRELKLLALGRVLDVERPTSAIIFCRTRGETDELTELLHGHGFKPMSLHGGLTQDQRDRVMQRFRAGAADLLIATDIAARGLDISQLSHVINFDVPVQAEAYVHRTGRVGRAGREGVAITLVTPSQQGALRQIERISNLRIPYAPIPSVKQLKAAKLKRIETLVTETVAKGGFSSELRGLLGTLEKGLNATDVALAALSLLGEPPRADDEIEISSPAGNDMARPGPGTRSAGPRSHGPGMAERPRAGGRPSRPGMAKVFFGIGRESGIQPRDLVGAIANEAGIPVKDLGTIDMTERFTLVEVPSEAIDYVVETMSGVRIRGRKIMVRPDRM